MIFISIDTEKSIHSGEILELLDEVERKLKYHTSEKYLLKEKENVKQKILSLFELLNSVKTCWLN